MTLRNNNKIYPFILGRGRAGEAVAKSIAQLRIAFPNWKLEEARWLEREKLKLSSFSGINPSDILLIVSNPPGLHASSILEAAALGIKNVICEKPACVNLEEVLRLRKLEHPIGIFHGYRVMWGPEEIIRKVRGGEIGRVVSVEGKYWQASTAERMQKTASERKASPTWKNDISLAGSHDAILDIGSHWLDLCNNILNEYPKIIIGKKSYELAEEPHRDTHFMGMLTYPSGTMGAFSVSKIAHGSKNDLELTVLGTKKSISWSFLNCDFLVIGEGRDQNIVTRKTPSSGSQLPPFHGEGWLEGYLEILRRYIECAFFGEPVNFPTLEQSLKTVECLLNVKAIEPAI